jgi:hypothetical protein
MSSGTDNLTKASTAEELRKRRCGNCEWWREQTGQPYGECMLNPPVPFLGHDQERPWTDHIDYCSNHQPKEPSRDTPF